MEQISLSISEMRDEHNKIVAEIEREFGARYRQREAFKDAEDAMLSLSRIRESQRAMRKGRAEQERAGRVRKLPVGK